MSPPTDAPAAALPPALAARLLELLARAHHPVGHRLTEQALADALGVSRSPVRKALSYLETLGAVRSEPNRGYSVAREPARLRRLRVAGDDESDEAVYMRLAEERLAGALPAEVSETELMKRHDLKRLQVQRVLGRMAREGLVERKAGRGWAFRPLLSTVESHRESYRFRMIIEPAALLEPTFRIDRAAFARVRREQEQMLDGGIETWSAAERFRVGAEFHETLVACANNRFLLDALRNVNRLRRLIEYPGHTKAPQQARERLHRQCREHLHLLDLIEAGERIEASFALRQHLDVVRVIKTGEPAAAATRAAAADAKVEVHL
jgi:DNA-binding GntR family transcriptional regulator